MVRTAGSGSGFLACFIDGPSKVALSCKEVDEGYEFSYTPFAPGKYLITVKYGNIGIAGSPYQAVVTGEFAFDVSEQKNNICGYHKRLYAPGYLDEQCFKTNLLLEQ